MECILSTDQTPCADASIYTVLNSKINEVSIKLEPLQEKQYTPLVGSYNQQQIFIWVRNHFNLPSGQGHGYTET